MKGERQEAKGKRGEGRSNRNRRDRPLCHLSQLIHYRDALQFHRPSKKPSQPVPSPKPITESHHAQRVSPSRNQHPFCNPLGRPTHVVLLQKRFALCLAPRRMRAAFLNCSGSCTPLAYFFLLLKKSRSPKASEATNNALGPNALEKRATSVRMGADRNLVSFNLRSN